jgi:hypothetical protein
VAYNFQIGNNKTKLLTEYEDVTQKVLFGNAVLAALMSGRIYDVIPQIGDVVTELNVEKDPPSDNAIRRWLKQFQETGSVLHRKGAAIDAGEHLQGN